MYPIVQLFLNKYTTSNLPESAGLETVWLKEATSRLNINKRTLSENINFPDELTFHLRRGSNIITLNLKRNRDIDPNADVYFVRTLKDGQSELVKTQNLRNEDIAYYQDRKKLAVMTVRCDKRSSEQCDRVIYGNIRIGHRNYALRPAEIDVTSRIHGKRYIIQDEEHISGHNSSSHKDTIRESEKKAEEGLKALFRRFNGKHTQNSIYSAGDTLSSREIPAFYNRWKTGRNGYSAQMKMMSRQLRKSYDVEVAVLIDESVWKLYSSLVHPLNPAATVGLVKRKITEAFSHIMNGVNLRYKTIDDPELSISVKLRDFIFFQI
ncbi:hypothetical protein CHS0354_001060 [Potamilus streckersoni]|uniref:Uncharacterized protein n=1 Tax=Potamilus streckersoni TaxID=2493646 RepID=A0AAE0SUE0_9BIVA|nr:hypothetical protein CHS0354_001060 [Potamilus streckersoni]